MDLAIRQTIEMEIAWKSLSRLSESMDMKSDPRKLKYMMIIFGSNI